MPKVIMPLEAKEEEEKKVEFTHFLRGSAGWTESDGIRYLVDFVSSIHYLGNCKVEGDMFAVYYGNGCIYIYKGHLNSGEY